MNFQKIEGARYFILSLNNGFNRIESLEERMYSEMDCHIDFSHWLSMLFPTTSYQSCTNELSSRGYENLLSHYRRVRDLKNEFVRYILYLCPWFSLPLDMKAKDFIKFSRQISAGAVNVNSDTGGNSPNKTPGEIPLPEELEEENKKNIGRVYKGEEKETVEELLYYLENAPVIRFAVLEYFLSYLYQHKDMIDAQIKKSLDPRRSRK
jgi:hypothetical protein